jgi:Transposase DDE domain
MSTIAFEDGGAQEETVSAFLMLVLEYGTEIGVFGICGLLDRLLHVAMKTVRYCPLYKAQTLMASIVMGCAHTKAINETLGQEVAAANYLGMSRFPDQSQINRYLTRFTAANVDELGAVHARLLRQQSQARRARGLRVVDIDQCGLVANGRTYEFRRKGYFPRKRGEEGYQMSLAYIGAYEEVVAVHLDPGNIPGRQRLPDLVHAVDCLLGPEETTADIIWRLDAGYDGPDTRAQLAVRPGYVVLKALSAKTAARVALAQPVQDWVPVAETIQGIEIPAVAGYRRVVYALDQADGTVSYALLYTTLPAMEWGIARLFAFYNERTTIEAFFAQSRHVHNIQNLRSRKFQAIAAFLHFVALTHNLLVWAKQARLGATALASASARHLVSYATRVRAQIHWDGCWHLRIVRSSSWATLLLEALMGPPQPLQLALPFARLHKT